MPMSELRAVNPPGWVRPKGYSNAIVAHGTQVFVAGQVGWDGQERFASDDFIEQLRQALKNTVDILAAAGAEPGHIARMVWYVLDKREYMARAAEAGAVWREIVGRHYPAITLVEVTALVADRARLEIESTAVIPDRD
jgi:enamine deaminase RidA (YjgF/YER057c/UK114 family)